METYGAAAADQFAPSMTAVERELQQPFGERVLKPLLLRIVRFLGSFLPHKQLSTIRSCLQLAGEPGSLTAAEFAGIKAGTMIMMALLGALRLEVGPNPTVMVLGSVVMMVAIGFKLPDIWLSRRIKQRQKELTNTLPDALDMLTIAVEAGLSFDQALDEISARWNNALSREFRRVLYEIGVGTSRSEALSHFSQRTGVPDIVSFVVAINQAEELGTSLGQVLGVQGQEMRIRRRQRAEEAANKLPVKMMFPMVFLIFPAVFAIVLGPAVPRIAQALGGVGR
jgi:tight adherence protein C